MLDVRKKCWVGSLKKWLFKNKLEEVVGFLPLVQLSLETTPGTMHIHPTHLVGVRGRAESQVFWCNTHNVQVVVRMVKLVTLQLVQSIGARYTTRGLMNQEAGAPPPLGFPTQC